MRSFACWAVAAVAAVALPSSSILAAVEVTGNSARFSWTPATGPVTSYLVEVSRDGGPFGGERIVPKPEVNIGGAFNQRLRVRVVALGSNGARSVPSEPSELIQFVGWSGVGDGSNGAHKVSSGANKKGSGASDKKSSNGSAKKSSNRSAKKSSHSADQARSGARSEPSAADRSRSRADGSSSQSPPRPASPTQGAMPYDFNGDGRTDLLWHNPEARALAVWLMNGTSLPLAAMLGTLEENWAPVGSGDFDGDGYADLLLRNALRGSSEIWFIEEGRVRAALSLDGRGANWEAEAIGDFDGDGRADVLWQKRERSLIWFMGGSAVDEEVYGPEVPESWTAACAPELDGDGRSDLIWGGGDETVAWLMNGPSPWRSGRAGPLMRTSLVLACGDADGDGLGDVLWYHPGSRRAILWVMGGDTGKDRSFGLPALRWGWAMEASGDFDGDGIANELLLRHSSSGTTELWSLRWSRGGFAIVSTGLSSRISGQWQAVAP